MHGAGRQLYPPRFRPLGRGDADEIAAHTLGFAQLRLDAGDTPLKLTH